MLSNQEFARQRAAKLNTEKTKDEKKQGNDYTVNKSIYNQRFDKKTMGKYLDSFNRYKVVMFLSIPFCIIISLAATFCLLVMEVIRYKFLIWLVAILFFIILYSGVISLFMYKGVKSHDELAEYESLKKAIRNQVEAELKNN